MVKSDLEMQQQTGMYRGLRVRVRVEGHRGRFGVEVKIVSEAKQFPAFIDSVLLTDRRPRPSQEEFPVVGTVLDAVVVAFMPNGELRLDARPSVVELPNPESNDSSMG